MRLPLSDFFRHYHHHHISESPPRQQPRHIDYLAEKHWKTFQSTPGPLQTVERPGETKASKTSAMDVHQQNGSTEKERRLRHTQYLGSPSGPSPFPLSKSFFHSQILYMNSSYIIQANRGEGRRLDEWMNGVDRRRCQSHLSPLVLLTPPSLSASPRHLRHLSRHSR
ncbi:hypothetical protein BD410DRAFT_624245 [Rickenella mellea]|uniref:Uncharacterized protein n=1 Tax=Rickenella mellea TaxID=50990 RepID=A0A4Y7PMQ7_9AGAM|nr:hypothetical protein BD410DRAFT_624245 [Rickenella mellea]